MGMFDTIHLKAPLVCPVCGAEQLDHQTHAFHDILAIYEIGSLVGGSVLSGIISETLWCSACHEAGNSANSPVYLVIWHSILAGVEQDLTRAEARLASVDRLDLIGWLDAAQRQSAKWQRRYHGLTHDLQGWHDHLDRLQNPEPARSGETLEMTARRESLSRLWGPAEEILTAADPLATIIARNKPDAADDREDGGW